jgi:hypothetical protein
MAEHGLAQQGGRFNILYAEHRTEKTNSAGLRKFVPLILVFHEINAFPQKNERGSVGYLFGY